MDKNHLLNRGYELVYGCRFLIFTNKYYNGVNTINGLRHYSVKLSSEITLLISKRSRVVNEIMLKGKIKYPHIGL